MLLSSLFFRPNVDTLIMLLWAMINVVMMLMMMLVIIVMVMMLWVMLATRRVIPSMLLEIVAVSMASLVFLLSVAHGDDDGEVGEFLFRYCYRCCSHHAMAMTGSLGL